MKTETSKMELEIPSAEEPVVTRRNVPLAISDVDHLFGKFTELSWALKYHPIKVKLQLLRKYQNIFQNIPNYRKVTNKSQKHKYFVPIFRFP